MLDHSSRLVNFNFLYNFSMIYFFPEFEVRSSREREQIKRLLEPSHELI